MKRFLPYLRQKKNKQKSSIPCNNCLYSVFHVLKFPLKRACFTIFHFAIIKISIFYSIFTYVSEFVERR